MAGGKGVRFLPEEDVDPLQVLFSESPTRVVVTVKSQDFSEFANLCELRDVWTRRCGVVVGDRVEVAGVLDLAIADVAGGYEVGLARAVQDPV